MYSFLTFSHCAPEYFKITLISDILQTATLFFYEAFSYEIIYNSKVWFIAYRKFLKKITSMRSVSKGTPNSEAEIICDIISQTNYLFTVTSSLFILLAVHSV
jgi:hypothetical protein